MKTKSMTTRKSMRRSSSRIAFHLILLTLVCIGLSPEARALLPAPTPDGGYPGPNTAEGQDALFSLTNGGFNTAIGAHALYGDTTGSSNTAVGAFVLHVNSSANGNVAVGSSALVNNQNAGNSSQAFGLGALFHQTTGLYNNGFGAGTLYSNVSGANNTAIGHRAGFHITGNGNVDIGSDVTGVAGENNTTRIRNIGTTAFNTGRSVQVGATGKLGYVVSARRYKDEIKPMDKASEALFALKPVTFRYKGDIDPAHAKMFGLIAEEVAEVNPDLVVRNAKGEVDTIRFDSI